MKAMVAKSFGPPDVLELIDTPVPEPGAGEVRVAVKAAGVNPVDAENRMDGSWAGITAPWIPGYEVAGLIDQVGPGVRGLKTGDRVMGMTHFRSRTGGYAEFVVVPADAIALLPDRVAFEAAAATPIAGGTAVEVLRRLRIAGGERLLVLGGSGGVGSFLLQLAVARGAEVIAVGRTEHHARMLDLGAIACVDYTQAGAIDAVQELAGSRMDAIVDLVGGATPSRWLECLKPAGDIASIQTPDLDLSDLLDENVTLHGVLLTNSGERTRYLARLLAHGAVSAHISRTLRLSEAAKAHEMMEQGHAGGKLVLIPESAVGSDSSVTSIPRARSSP